MPRCQPAGGCGAHNVAIDGCLAKHSVIQHSYTAMWFLNSNISVFYTRTADESDHVGCELLLCLQPSSSRSMPDAANPTRRCHHRRGLLAAGQDIPLALTPDRRLPCLHPGRRIAISGCRSPRTSGDLFRPAGSAPVGVCCCFRVFSCYLTRTNLTHLDAFVPRHSIAASELMTRMLARSLANAALVTL